MAATTANVSYRNPLTPQLLSQALETGERPQGYEPQISTLLDEAPIPIVVKAVDEVARTKHISPKKIWQHLRRWSEMLQATRKVWA